GLDDGFYWLFASGSGSTQLTATQTRYQADTRTVDVAGNTATRADFAPSAGLVTLGTTAVTATTELGESTTSTVTLHNAGTAPATVHLAEAPGHVEIRSASTSASSSAASGPPVRRTHGHFSPGAHAETAKGAQPRSRRQALAAAGPSALPWEPATDYPTVVAGNAVGYHDGTVYSVGGYTRSGPTAAGYSYEAESGRWSPMADMPRARESAAGEFLGGKLYVAGGWSVTEHVRADMDVYDPHTNTWSAGPHLPTAAAGSGTAVLDGKLYVVGGCRGSCGKQFVLRYDPDTRSWSTLAHYPRDTARLACGGIDGKVYCAGGATDGGSSARTYAYDPGTDTWTRKADLPIDLWGMASTVSSGTLMVSGGVTGGGTAITNQGFAYHPDTDTWTALPNSTYATYNSGSACGFYKVGGASTGDAVPTQLVELLPGFADCGAGDPVAWLSASHTGATLQPGETVHVELRVDGSAVSQPGTYTAGFEVRADTPYATNRIGVTAEVTPPARWGKLTGVVSGESCDGSTQPLPGATVLVRSWAGDHTLRTDRNGRYTLWLDHRSNPLSLLVVTSGWTPETARARVKAGKTTTRNIDLQQTGCTNSHRRSS
ncbi:MAG: Kelch repeat-containing protein, partial [Nocardioidaceae bacterium]